ncbi:HK97 gp10 family phage protein [Oceanobacillus sp. FSL K6-2867]|uniref:HK97 gp10 family phage protein n=1 Tax=Oceanobacillus sp. FSL K6-2867 TaxID=2954748 RepID=UPI0030DA4285
MAKNEISFSQLAKKFSKMADDVEDVAEQALNVIAEDLLSESIDLAPLDEGGLRENGSVDPATKIGGKIVAKVGYDKEYALRRHEEFYNAQVEGTGRKYLEIPTTQNAQKYVNYLAEKIGDAIDD